MDGGPYREGGAGLSCPACQVVLLTDGSWRLSGWEKLLAATTAPAPAATPGIKLGDATVYTLVNRRWQKVDPPKRDLVLHADGTVEVINDKTDKPWLAFAVKPDGSVSADGKPMGSISERGVIGPDGQVQIPLDGDTLSVTIDANVVKVSLGADGAVTVHDRPDGVKWKIDAADPAVRRTAFLALGLTMKTALD